MFKSLKINFILFFVFFLLLQPSTTFAIDSCSIVSGCPTGDAALGVNFSGIQPSDLSAGLFAVTASNPSGTNTCSYGSGTAGNNGSCNAFYNSSTGNIECIIQHLDCRNNPFSLTVSAPSGYSCSVSPTSTNLFNCSNNLPISVSCTPPASDIATCVSYSVNSGNTIYTNSTVPAQVRMQNNGNQTWTSAANYKLGSTNPLDNITWGLSRVSLPTTVSPGGIATFNFNVLTPSSPGNYIFGWGMVKDGAYWLTGATCTPGFQVLAPPPSAPSNLSASCPSPGNLATVSWTNGSGATSHNVRINNTANGWSGICSSLFPGDFCLENTSSPRSFSSTAGAGYTWWVEACNSSGCTPSTGPNFSCAAALPPTVTTNPATSVFQTTATLNSTINPNGSATTSWFRYSNSSPGASCNDFFGTRVPASGGNSKGSGTSNVTDSQNISALSVGTTYYFCALAASTAGTTANSNVQQFITIPDVIFSASPNPINSGSSTTLTWNIIGSATSCTVSNGGIPTITSGSWSGTLTGSDVLPGSHSRPITMTSSTSANRSFDIYCSNSSGSSAVRTQVVTVNPVGIPPAPTVSTPACINAGYTGSGVNISWSNSGVTWVDIDDDSGFAQPYYHKAVSGVFSTTAPTGFNAFPSGGSLSLNPNTNYSVRTYNGSQNSGVNSFNIPSCAQPDLIVDSLSPTSAVLGNSVTFSGRVVNSSSTASGASSTRLRFASIAGGGLDTTPANQSVGALAAGGTQTASWASVWTAAGVGNHAYEICADTPISTVAESNEANNCTSGNINVTSAPAFDYTLSNSGNITVNQGSSGSNTITRTYISGTTAGVTLSVVSGLPSGASASFTSNPCSPTCASTLTISTLSTTPVGSYPISVTGSPLGVSTTPTNFTLIVTSSSSGIPWIQTTGGDVHSNTKINTQ
jgi:hypothetical protein